MSTSEPGAASSQLQTVDRALELLLSFDEFRSDWGVQEVASTFGWSTSTAQRLLASLATRGFLRADPVTRRYGLGPAVWRMAALWERSGGLARVAETSLVALARGTGRTALFCVAENVHVRCIAAVGGQEGPRRSHPFLDELYPAHAGATSRAHFAFLDRGERRGLLAGRPLARFSGRTQVDVSALEELFDETVDSGYALSEGEYDPASRALAVPVFTMARPVGSLTLVEHRRPAPPDDLLDHLPALQHAAEEISALLSNRRLARTARDRAAARGARSVRS